jgi:adenylate cyclase
VFFGNAPFDERRHAELASRAALAMQAAMPGINAALGDILTEPLRIGIAVNTGPCVVGNVGSRRRFDYSAMGDAVNIAARLQEESKRYGIPIVIGASTAAQAETLATLAIDDVRLRGRAGNVGLCALLGDERYRESPGFERLRTLNKKLVEGIRAGDHRAVDAVLEDLQRGEAEAAGILLKAYESRVSALRAGTLMAARIAAARA